MALGSEHGPQVGVDTKIEAADEAHIGSGAARVRARRWKIAYRRRVLIADILALTVAIVIAQWVGAVRDGHRFFEITHRPIFLIVVSIGWLIALGYVHSRDISLAGLHGEEYHRVIRASLWTFTVTAAFMVFLGNPVSRFQFGAFGLAFIFLFLARFIVRADLRRRRRHGTYISRVVVVGDLDAARTLCGYFVRNPGAGYRVVGLCVPDSDQVGQEVTVPGGTVPIIGYKEDRAIESAVLSAGADTLAVVYSERLGPEQIKYLAWRMEAIHTQLLVVPGLTEVARHRLQLRPLENLPLFAIEEPTHDATSMLTKRALDITLSCLGLLVALPVIALAGLAIKLDDRGPIFYRQQRVGLNGKPFSIFKLRSMYVDTDKTPQSEQHRHGSMFHKRTSDSCVTRVGKVLRATSIDELPQLFNVLEGSMSIVGPRPLAVGEAGSDEAFIEHREHVKPGMTGLWQVSGRSDLEDKDRVRLDVSYAGNWSVVGDLVIIWRTVGAVLKRKGAY